MSDSLQIVAAIVGLVFTGCGRLGYDSRLGDGSLGERNLQDDSRLDGGGADRFLPGDAVVPLDTAGPDRGVGSDASLTRSRPLRVWYADDGNGVLKERTWDDMAETWAAPDPVAGPEDLRWVMASAHDGIGETLVATLSDTLERSTLTMHHHGGADWVTDWSVPAATSDRIAFRGYAVAHEGLSGDGLAVWSTGGPGLSYRTRNQGIWGTADAVPINDGAGPGPDLTASGNLWVRLVTDPNSDRIALLFSNEERDLLAILWDGAEWMTRSGRLLDTDLAFAGTMAPTYPVHMGFDGAFEANSGDLLVVWGHFLHPGFYYATYAGSWTLPPPVGIAGHFRTQVARLSAAPANDHVVFAGAARDGTETLALATWDGNAWIDPGTYDGQLQDLDATQTSDTSDEPLGLSWVGSDLAVCIYPDDTEGTLDWVTWTPTEGWIVQPDVEIPSLGFLESVAFAQLPSGDGVMAVFSDSNARLIAARFDGSGWVVDGNESLTSTLISTSTRPFAVR